MKVMGGTHPVCYSTINKRSCEGILLTPVSWSLHISFKVNRISSRYTFQLNSGARNRSSLVYWGDSCRDFNLESGGSTVAKDF